MGSGWGSKKKGEAGMGRLVSDGPALYREERGKGRYERQGVRTLLDCVLLCSSAKERPQNGVECRAK